MVNEDNLSDVLLDCTFCKYDAGKNELGVLYDSENDDYVCSIGKDCVVPVMYAQIETLNNEVSNGPRLPDGVGYDEASGKLIKVW